MTIDTAGLTIGTDATSGFSGVGGVTVTGGGIFNLAVISIYTGETRIDTGTLARLSGAMGGLQNNRMI